MKEVKAGRIFHGNVLFKELLRMQQNRKLPFFHYLDDEKNVLVYCDPDGYGDEAVRIENNELIIKTRVTY